MSEYTDGAMGPVADYAYSKENGFLVNEHEMHERLKREGKPDECWCQKCNRKRLALAGKE